MHVLSDSHSVVSTQQAVDAALTKLHLRHRGDGAAGAASSNQPAAERQQSAAAAAAHGASIQQQDLAAPPGELPPGACKPAVDAEASGSAAAHADAHAAAATDESVRRSSKSVRFSDGGQVSLTADATVSTPFQTCIGPSNLSSKLHAIQQLAAASPSIAAAARHRRSARQQRGNGATPKFSYTILMSCRAAPPTRQARRCRRQMRTRSRARCLCPSCSA